MPLRNLVREELVACSPDTPIFEVADLMKSKDIGSVLIVESEKPIGIVTDRDIVLRCVCDNLDYKTPISQIMSESVATVTDHDGIQDVIRLMKEHEVRRIPVVDNLGRPVGLISFGDILGLLAKEMSELSHDTPFKVAA